MRSYTDDQLARAVADSQSWRGVLRALNLAATSSASIRSVRSRADLLGLDHRHFTGQRRWTDAQLARAVAAASSWAHVAQLLGLAGGSSAPTLKGHALRLGIETCHLTRARPAEASQTHAVPSADHLRRAGSLLAAAWFELCGREVAWPLEPCRYDLVVWGDAGPQRIQVKTTTFRTGSSWTARLSTGSGKQTAYDPDDVDAFFVIDGDLNHYLIPIRSVGGLTAIQLSAYADYLLPRLDLRPADD